MPEVDVTEDRWLFRLVTLRSSLKAIVPTNTASGFEWAVDMVWQLKLGVRKELMNSRMGTYLDVRRVGDSVLSTVEKGMKDSPGAGTPYLTTRSLEVCVCGGAGSR